MNYRSIADLNQAVLRQLPNLPHDIDLVVGIPRSGMLPATMIALYRNLPLTDLEGMLAGRLIGSGARLNHGQHITFEQFHKILVVDDSICDGTALRRAREQLQGIMSRYQWVFAAVYATQPQHELLDFQFEECPLPRVFEWNLFHHAQLESACVDIDGVLCVDPAPEENDDGERYLHFLQHAQPLTLPTRRINHLVTCRLEKYRAHTESWLKQHGVIYNHLEMMDYATQQERMQANCYGKYKAGVYNKTINTLFIESSLKQATEIVQITGKPVFCTETRALLTGTPSQQLYQTLRGEKWKWEAFIKQQCRRFTDYTKSLIRSRNS